MAPLKCDGCGTLATGDLALVASPGGTHYRIVEHGVGIPGRRPTRNARACGKWCDTPETVAEKAKAARAIADRFAELVGGHKP